MRAQLRKAGGAAQHVQPTTSHGALAVAMLPPPSVRPVLQGDGAEVEAGTVPSPTEHSDALVPSQARGESAGKENAKQTTRRAAAAPPSASAAAGSDEGANAGSAAAGAGLRTLTTAAAMRTTASKSTGGTAAGARPTAARAGPHKAGTAAEPAGAGAGEADITAAADASAAAKPARKAGARSGAGADSAKAASSSAAKAGSSKGAEKSAGGASKPKAKASTGGTGSKGAAKAPAAAKGPAAPQAAKRARAEPYVFDESSVGVSKSAGDLLKVLEAAKKEHTPGEEPWRAYEGLAVNEEPLVDAAHKIAVGACTKEYWRRYRLAVESEDQRIARVTTERAAAGLAGNDGDGDADDGEDADEAGAGEAAAKQPKKLKALSKRPDRVAEAEMLRNGMAINREKVFGHVPGIDVNDRFILRSEILCVGLHQTPMAGICYAAPKDVMKMTRGALNRPVAVSVVVSGNYEDDLDTQTTVIYTGEGGNDFLGNKRQIKGQELVRGNAALVGNYELGIPVRILRKNSDATSCYNHVYLYDGLFDVVSLCKAVGNSGFIVWKYLLQRRASQPESMSKPIEFGGVTSAPRKAHVLSRPNIICKDMSKGLERLPVVVVNEVNRELPPGLDPEVDAGLLVNDKEGQPLVKAPYELEYVVDYTYDTGIPPPQPPSSCASGSCSAGTARQQQQQQEQQEEPHEMLLRLNVGRLPYSSNGIASDLMSLIVECGDWTGCREGDACLQRQVQRGLQYRLEVFKTRKCSWGVRSWDSIPAGAFVAGFYGRVINYDDAGEGQYADDTYHFDMMRRTDCSNDHKLLKEPRTFEQKYIIDAKQQGGVARFINHSCSPNLYVQPVCVGHADDEMPGIALFALQPIQPWQELTYDYGRWYLQTKLKDGCHCGAPECQNKPRQQEEDPDMAQQEEEEEDVST